MGKRVLLTGPFTRESIAGMRWVTPPLGVHHIASYLNSRGHDTHVYDCNMPGICPFEETVKTGWDIIGFSILEATVEYDLAKIHEAKRLHPDALLVAGGTGASLNYQTLFEKSLLDIVILGEGEIPMLELCNGKPLDEIDGIIFRRHAKPMTKELWQEIRTGLDIKAMQVDKYWRQTAGLYDNPDFNEINTFRIFTTNFCPMGCHFCTLTKLRQYACGKNTPVIALPIPQVMEMIKKIRAEYPQCKQIFIVDDDAFLLPNRTVELCESIINLKNENYLPQDLRFICLTNINRLNEENLPLIADAGFRVLSIGVESTSQHVLDSYNKKQTVEQIFRVTEMILRHGIRPYYTAIFWHPFARVEDLLIDLSGFRKLADMGAGLSLEQRLIPLHGTKFWEDGMPCKSTRIKIGGTDDEIVKPIAWLPVDPEVLKLFKIFEEIYPKFRKWRMDTEEKERHLEKNWQSKTILDCAEFVLRERYNIRVKEPVLLSSDIVKIELALAQYGDMRIDTTGNIIEEKEEDMYEST